MPLRSALARLARKGDVSVSFGDLPVDGYRSSYVVGARTVDEAVDRLLRGTPFTFERGDSETIRIVRRGALSESAPREIFQPPDTPDIIIVNATKRPADARRLAVSVSSVGGDELENSGVIEASDLFSRLAGVAFTNLGVSRNKIFVRGLSDGPFADRTQSTVGVYLDETPLILNDTNPDLQMLDLERVELIRGPQGSLYGGGSIGGLLKMTTAKPRLDDASMVIGAMGTLTRGGSPGAEVDAVANLPIVAGEFGARLAAYHRALGGFIDDVGLGREDVNASTVTGGRLALRHAPGNIFIIDGMVAFQRVDADGAQYAFADLPGIVRSTSRAEPYRDAFNLASITVTGDFPGLSLKSATSFTWRNSDFAFDATAALPSLIKDNVSTGLMSNSDRNHSIFHETRAVFEDLWGMKALAGVFVLSRNERLDSELELSPDGALPFILGRNDSYRELALFGETSIDLSNNLTLTLGARMLLADFEVDSVSAGALANSQGAIEVRNSRLAFSPKATLARDISDRTMVYGQIARGSRAGGVNLTGPLDALFDPDSEAGQISFEPDSLWNFEFGVKSRLLDDRLDIAASAFYVLWNNMQTDQFLPSGFSYIANAGRARNYGLELETTIRPIENLEIRTALFVNSPELRSANPLLGAQRGDALPNIANISAGISASYHGALGKRWRWGVDGDFSYLGRSFLTFASGSAAPMGDFETLALRAYVSRRGIMLGVDAENVMNERGNTFSFGNPFSAPFHVQETPLRPRTVGVFLRKEF